MSIPRDILPRVTKCVAEVLALDPAEIPPDSRMMDDLGADSLDLVELMYLLEQEFDITLSRDDLSLTAQLGIPEEKIYQNEVLTPEALDLLRQHFPSAREILVSGTTRKQLAGLITVHEVCRAVQQKLG